MSTEDKSFATLILAAGKGTRMKSDLVKVLHPVAGRPMLDYVLNLAEQMGSSRIAVIIGHQAELVEDRYANRGFAFVYQREQLGTGHAVLQAAEAFAGYHGTILILCGDVPLLRASTLRDLMERHSASGAAITVLTTLLEDPSGYGRIVKDAGGNVLGIVEHRDATDEQRKIREINTGIYCAENPFLFEAVSEIGSDNAQREYYFTDIFAIARRKGVRTASVIAPDPGEVMGINAPDDLARATHIMQARLNKQSVDGRSWWDVVSGKLKRGDEIFTPGKGKDGKGKKPFCIVSVTSDSLKVLSGDYHISLERQCFEIIETEYRKNPFLSLRVAAIKENVPLDGSADKLIRDATNNNMARGNYVCAILEYCGLVRYEMQGNKKTIVMSKQ